MHLVACNRNERSALHALHASHVILCIILRHFMSHFTSFYVIFHTFHYTHHTRRKLARLVYDARRLCCVARTSQPSPLQKHCTSCTGKARQLHTMGTRIRHKGTSISLIKAIVQGKARRGINLGNNGQSTCKQGPTGLVQVLQPLLFFRLIPHLATNGHKFPLQRAIFLLTSFRQGSLFSE